MNNKKTIISLLSLIIVFTVVGGTLAYWTWNSTENTGLAFTVTREFSCSADGGEPITSQDISLIPVDVEKFPDKCAGDGVNVLKRTVTVSADIKKDGLTVGMDLWLTVNSIAEALSNSENLRYALTTNKDSCTTDVVSEGNFKGLTTGGQASLLTNSVFTETDLTSKTYYLYIWLDKDETDNETQDKTFDLSLGGQCADTPQPNKPVIDENAMIPVKIEDNGTLIGVSPDDPSWYNYDNKEWANAVTVESWMPYYKEIENETPENYHQAHRNEIVDAPQIAYYVWIPRFKYKISTNVACSDLTNATIETHPECYNKKYTLLISEEEFIEKTYWTLIDGYGFCNTWEDGTIDNFSCSESDIAYFEKLFATGSVYIDFNGYDQTIYLEDYLDSEDYKVAVTKVDKIVSHGGVTSIDISFESADAPMTLENATSEYRTHPAFWWDNDNDNIVDSDEMLPGIWVGKFEASEGDDRAGPYVIVPNRLPLTGLTIANMFSLLQDGRDHMIKNSEWGAVAYLSHSKYGINKEVRINNSSVYTGCGASTANAGSTSGCPNAFGTVSSYPQSTTGNITGVFDMSGGANEFVMGHFGNAINDNGYDSGFSELPDKKYYDVYPTDIFVGTDSTNLGLCTIDTCGGHALNETAGWYSDNKSGAFVNATKPFFVRGGKFDSGASAGVFAFNDQSGASTTFGSRSVRLP
ncbi:MAG: hypothetical protein IJE89_00965 [Bacilli bacterium]|nr:hypothetical protein [Bacilli bacterium]